MWPNQQQQPWPFVGARPDPAGCFSQSCPLGLGSEGKWVVKTSLTFFRSDQLASPAATTGLPAHPRLSLAKCPWR